MRLPSDNDSNVALYNVSNQKPGDTYTKCIRVTYTGTLPSEVRLYTPSSIGALGPYVDLVITPGTQSGGSFPDCSSGGGFVPDAGGAIVNDTLSSFASQYNSFANGIEFNPGGGSGWVQNDELVYRLQVTLKSDAPFAAQSQTTGTHAYEWQAQNQ